MPPELSTVWREHDQRLSDAPNDERHKGAFDSLECAHCKAEHPWLGRWEGDSTLGRYVIVNPDELIKTCLVCGGEVGRRFGTGFVTGAQYAREFGR